LADNTTLDSGSGGDSIVTREISHAGDTSKLPGSFLMGITGAEGSYTAAAINGDAANGLDVDVTRVSGTVTISGAVTNAGTFVVQENGAALTALQLIDNLVLAEDAAHVSGDVGIQALTVRQDAAAALGQTDGDYQPLVTDSTGRLHVNVGNTVTVGSHAVTNAGTFAVQAAQSGTWTVQPGNTANSTAWLVTGTGGTFPVTDSGGSLTVDAPVGTPAFVRLSDGSAAISTLPVSLATVPSHAVTNAGTFVVQIDGSALTSFQLLDDTVYTDDAAFTPGTSKLLMVGAQADEASTDSVDEGDAGALRMTLDRKLLVAPQAHTAGGCLIFRTLDLDETEEDVKTSAGQVYGIFAINTTNAVLYLKLYNATAANVTVGTTTPVMTLPVPGNNDTDGAGFYLNFPVGVVFDTAICAAATTAVADNDTGAPGANALIVQVFYK
jgi:hypothetical protein